MQAEETEAVPGERKRSCVRVVKAGGSFFDDPDFPRRLRRWIDQQPPALNLVIFGGGPLVDSMRELDQRFQFGAAWVHWTCIDLLAITWQMACKLLPEWDMCPTKAG